MTTVADSLPPEIKDASAWYGPDLKGRTEWIERLSGSEIAEVEIAVKRLEGSSLDLRSIKSDDFPLPLLGARLHRLLDEVLNGRGFVLIRSLPIHRWTRRQAAIAFRPWKT
jgi:hypothetical protein